MLEVLWPVGKALWSTTSACASVPGSSRVRPLTPDSAPKLQTPCLEIPAPHADLKTRFYSRGNTIFYPYPIVQLTICSSGVPSRSSSECSSSRTALSSLCLAFMCLVRCHDRLAAKLHPGTEQWYLPDHNTAFTSEQLADRSGQPLVLR